MFEPKTGMLYFHISPSLTPSPMGLNGSGVGYLGVVGPWGGDLPVVGIYRLWGYVESSGGGGRGRWGSRGGGQNFLLAPSIVNPGYK